MAAVLCCVLWVTESRPNWKRNNVCSVSSAATLQRTNHNIAYRIHVFSSPVIFFKQGHEKYAFCNNVMSCRFRSYAVLRLHVTHDYTIWKLLRLPRNTSLTLCRWAVDSAMVILVFGKRIALSVATFLVTRLATARGTSVCRRTSAGTKDLNRYKIMFLR
jgi:hypothetical protein